MIEPISPDEIEVFFPGVQYNECVSRINEAITVRDWYSEFVDDHYGLRLSKTNWYRDSLLDEVVKSFKGKGWDCLYKQHYDAHGTYQCFYVHKKHFK